MSNDTNGSIDTHGPQGGVVLLRGEGDARYILPSAVLEAFRVDEARLAALPGEGDVAGYLEWDSVWRDYTVYRLDGGGAVSFWAGWAWNQFTYLVAGSDAKFEYDPPGPRGMTGVRG